VSGCLYRLDHDRFGNQGPLAVTEFLRTDGEERVWLAKADRACLRALEGQLDMNPEIMKPEMRTTEE
jgi:hypothetical protein